jgi:hypothetical protein
MEKAVWVCNRQNMHRGADTKINSLAFSPQANNIELSTAAGGKISVDFCGYRVLRGQRT